MGKWLPCCYSSRSDIRTDPPLGQGENKGVDAVKIKSLIIIVGVLLLLALIALGRTMVPVLFSSPEYGIMERAREVDFYMPKSGVRYEREELSDAEKGNLSIKVGGGYVRIDGSSQEAWFEGEMYGPGEVRPILFPGIKTVRSWLHQRENWWQQTEFRHFWDISLNKEIPWRLTLDVSLIGADLDLRDVEVKGRYRLQNSQLNLSLDENSLGSTHTFYTIHSQIVLNIPPHVPAKVSLLGLGIENNLEDWGWQKEGFHYFSPAYKEGEEVVIIKAWILSSAVTLMAWEL